MTHRDGNSLRKRAGDFPNGCIHTDEPQTPALALLGPDQEPKVSFPDYGADQDLEAYVAIPAYVVYFTRAQILQRQSLVMHDTLIAATAIDFRRIYEVERAKGSCLS